MTSSARRLPTRADIRSFDDKPLFGCHTSLRVRSGRGPPPPGSLRCLDREKVAHGGPPCPPAIRLARASLITRTIPCSFNKSWLLSMTGSRARATITIPLARARCSTASDKSPGRRGPEQKCTKTSSEPAWPERQRSTTCEVGKDFLSRG